ncbi:MAG: anaphase promoting complex subunit 5 [Alyxoria varia]|nr:MAG: anaphase promoting complex subunit 5 [Alyxoria varia]
MSRFLTPAKVSLLTLIAMYCDGYVPKEATITVLSFLTSHLTPSVNEVQKSRDSLRTYASTTLQDIQNILKGIKSPKPPADSLWDNFLYASWRIENLDMMFDFFSNLHQLFRKRPHAYVSLTSTSLMGVFVRRAVVEFERLGFQDAVSLWMEYKYYRAAGTPASFPAKVEDGTEWEDHTSFAPNIKLVLENALGREVEFSVNASSSDVEKLLGFQIEKMQSKKVIEPMRSSFLNSWYAGDYPSSFENLHQYYDYAMSNKDRSHYQYALLNLAILHADFGCYDEAMAAMEETIATARENKDIPCLNFSLSWLQHFCTFYDGHPNNGIAPDATGTVAALGAGGRSLGFLKEKAKEFRMWSIVSSSLLNEARVDLVNGCSPQLSLERVYEASHLNMVHQLESVKSSQLLVQSSIYGRLGIAPLATAYCDLVTDCYKTNSPLEEIVRARARTAHNLALAGDYKGSMKVLEAMTADADRNIQLHQYLSVCIGLVKLKQALHNNNLCHAEKLLNALKSAPRPPDAELTFQISTAEIDYHMRLRNHDIAYDKLEILLGDDDTEASIDFASTHETASAPAKNDKATPAATAGASTSTTTTAATPPPPTSTTARSSTTDTHQMIRLLTLKCRLLARCGRPQKSLTIALRAVAAAYTSRIMPALWEAVEALADALNGIGEYEASVRCVEGVVEGAAEGGDARVVGAMWMRGADGLVGLAGLKEDKERWEGLRRALQWLEKGGSAYEAIEDFEGEVDSLRKRWKIYTLLARGNHQQGSGEASAGGAGDGVVEAEGQRVKDQEMAVEIVKRIEVVDGKMREACGR